MKYLKSEERASQPAFERCRWPDHLDFYILDTTKCKHVQDILGVPFFRMKEITDWLIFLSIQKYLL